MKWVKVTAVLVHMGLSSRVTTGFVPQASFLGPSYARNSNHQDDHRCGCGGGSGSGSEPHHSSRVSVAPTFVMGKRNRADVLSTTGTLVGDINGAHVVEEEHMDQEESLEEDRVEVVVGQDSTVDEEEIIDLVVGLLLLLFASLMIGYCMARIARADDGDDDDD